MLIVKMPHQHNRRIMLIQHRNIILEYLFTLLLALLAALFVWGVLWFDERVVRANMVLSDAAIEAQELKVRLEAEKHKEEAQRTAWMEAQKVEYKRKILAAR